MTVWRRHLWDERLEIIAWCVAWFFLVLLSMFVALEAYQLLMPLP